MKYITAIILHNVLFELISNSFAIRYVSGEKSIAIKPAIVTIKTIAIAISGALLA